MTESHTESHTDAPTDAGLPPELVALRRSIDNIDAAVVHLLAERFKCTQQVGKLKADQGLPPADPAREEAQVARLRDLAHTAGLDPVFAEKFLNFVIAEVINHHIQLANPGVARRPESPSGDAS
jgi:chorismate mutase